MWAICGKRPEFGLLIKMTDHFKSDNSLPLKQITREFFLQTVSLIDPQKLITDRLKLDGTDLVIDNERISLTQFNRIIVIGFGKASLKMAVGLQSILAYFKIEGVVATNGMLPSVNITGLEVIVAGHPYPDAGSWHAVVGVYSTIRDF